ncbi:hypothetical protein HG530_010946 [Fusarium avenaceum]|nr:hypothetical protein HG530_010946 [Fusarium avenaceum]
MVCSSHSNGPVNNAFATELFGKALDTLNRSCESQVLRAIEACNLYTVPLQCILQLLRIGCTPDSQHGACWCILAGYASVVPHSDGFLGSKSTGGEWGFVDLLLCLVRAIDGFVVGGAVDFLDTINGVGTIDSVDTMVTVITIHFMNSFNTISAIDAIDAVHTVEVIGTIGLVDAIGSVGDSIGDLLRLVELNHSMSSRATDSKGVNACSAQ